MVFSEKLKMRRMQAGMTQAELAKSLGVTCRTLQNYEGGNVYPKSREIYAQLAVIFQTDINFWLTEPDGAEQTVSSCKETVLADVKKVFSEGILEDTELDDLMRSIQNVYWEAKDQIRNK